MVSACLLGRACRYDGASKADPAVIEALEGQGVVAVCPEELGGLGTPRPSAELRGGDGLAALDGRASVVREADGIDVTAAFIAGARAAARRAEGARTAILKARSPSCGCGATHIDGAVRPGDGVFAALLRQRGVRVMSDETLRARRPLGPLHIHPMVMGTWAFGGWFWGGFDRGQAVRALHAAADAGVNLVDTAPLYGFGDAERLVGEALRGRDVMVATKCGLRWPDTLGEGFSEAQAEAVGGPGVYRCLRPESVTLECERSLRRLGREVIDLFQLHWPDPDTPIADTMGAMLRLQERGLIRAIGVSNVSPDQLREASAVAPVVATQEAYSLLDRRVEDGLVDACEDLGVGILAYSPVASGLLTGRLTAERALRPGDKRAERPAFAPARRTAVNRALARLEPLLEGRTPASLALAWVLARPGVAGVVFGARTPAQVIENLDALRRPLSPEQADAVARLFEGPEPP